MALASFSLNGTAGFLGATTGPLPGYGRWLGIESFLIVGCWVSSASTEYTVQCTMK
jgi:hypothetical protein